MCLIRITVANLCPNMINFDAYNFSECRSEEVISFFWCSVYWKYLLGVEMHLKKKSKTVDLTPLWFSWISHLSQLCVSEIEVRIQTKWCILSCRIYQSLWLQEKSKQYFLALFVTSCRHLTKSVFCALFGNGAQTDAKMCVRVSKINASKELMLYSLC